MQRTNSITGITIAALLVAMCVPASAQPPGFGGRFGGGDGGRGSSPWGGSSRFGSGSPWGGSSRFGSGSPWGGDRGRDSDRGRGRDDDDDDRRRGFDLSEIVRSADDNGDGVIEPSELGSRSGEYVRRAAAQRGLDASRPIRVDQLLPALQAMSGSSSSGGSASSPDMLGFTYLDTQPRVPGFDVPLSVTVGTGVEQRFESRIVDYVKRELLQERDINRNGILERSEWTGRWRPPAAEADLNGDGVLDMEEMCLRTMKQTSSRGDDDNDRRDRGRDSDRGREGDRSSFFSRFTGGTPSSASGSGSSSSNSSGSTDRSRIFAESMIRMNDTNKNGKLEKNEWGNVRGDPNEIDTNKDGVITADEMGARLASFSMGRGSWGSRGGDSSGSERGERGERGDGDRGRGFVSRGFGPPGFGGPQGVGGPPGFGSSEGGREGGGRDGGDRGWGTRGFGGERSRGDDNDEDDRHRSDRNDAEEADSAKKLSFRLRSPTERLPDNIPDWYLRADGNGDGQVSMSEYSTSWNDEIAQKFMKLDANGDGIITSEECLASGSSSR